MFSLSLAFTWNLVNGQSSGTTLIIASSAHNG